MGSRLDEIIDSSTAALVGIVLICTALIPIGMTFIDKLAPSAAEIEQGAADYSEFVPLLTVVIFIAIIGLIIGVLKTFQSNKR